MKKHRDNAKGFTLIELMVVIVILGILATLIVPRFMDEPDRAKQQKAKVDITSLETALKMYRLDMGAYPTTEQGLEALVAAPEGTSESSKWRKGGYLEKGKVPKDPWNHDYVYLCPGSNGDFDLISYGSDGQPGGESFASDINSWEIQ